MKVALLLLICVHKKQSDPIDKCMRGALINRIGFDLTRSQVGTTNRSKVIRKVVSNENEELECIPYELPAEDLCSPLSEAGSGVKWGSQAMNVTGRPHFSTPRTLEYSISAPLTNILQRAEGGVDFEVARVACFLRSGRRLDRCRQQMGEIGNQEQTIGDSGDDWRRRFTTRHHYPLSG